MVARMSRHNVYRATSRLDSLVALLCATGEQLPDTTDRLEYEMPQ